MLHAVYLLREGSSVNMRTEWVARGIADAETESLLAAAIDFCTPFFDQAGPEHCDPAKGVSELAVAEHRGAPAHPRREGRLTALRIWEADAHVVELNGVGERCIAATELGCRP